MITVLPRVTDALLVNPGVGFVAAPGLMCPAEAVKDSRGNSVEAYQFAENQRTWNHPDSGVFFCSFRWKDLEPSEGVYDWTILDERLNYAKELGCTAVVRIAPHALSAQEDIPGWLRERYPEMPEYPFWRIDPNTTEYPRLWARIVRAFAERYDGHPVLSAVDISIVGAWGEGAGAELMREEDMDLIVRAYLHGFTRTPLHTQIHDLRSVACVRKYRRDVGMRMDCLGDMGGFHPGKWSHMLDFYPHNIANFDMGDAWKRGPVMFEACWHMNDWYLQGWDIDYIIEESLKWHISAYASKGTTVPKAWQECVTRWVRRMGYRYEIHRCRFDGRVFAGGTLAFEMLLSNSGVAPCYHSYAPTLRLVGAHAAYELPLDADIREWMPDEDHIISQNLALPTLMEPGDYTLQLGFPVPSYAGRTLALAIEGRNAEGYYPLGNVTVAPEGKEEKG